MKILLCPSATRHTKLSCRDRGRARAPNRKQGHLRQRWMSGSPEWVEIGQLGRVMMKWLAIARMRGLYL